MGVVIEMEEWRKQNRTDRNVDAVVGYIVIALMVAAIVWLGSLIYDGWVGLFG